ENQVIAFSTFGEIFLGVINDPVGADGSDHVQIRGAAHAGYLCAKRLGDLHRERPDASGRAVNQDLLTGLKFSVVAKTLQRGESSDRYGSRLIERDRFRLRN